jgi:hypothetical protein
MRLPACIFFACCLPVTFFWYGWSADKAVHVNLVISASFHKLIKIAVDCPGHWPCPVRLWHDGYLHSHSNLYHRFLPYICCLWCRSLDYCTIPLWGLSSTSRAFNVPSVGSRLGQFCTRFHCHWFDSCTFADL